MRNAPGWFWLVLLVPIGMLVTAVHDMIGPLSPRVGGYYDQWGHAHNYRDNGDRFIHASLMFGLAVMSAYATVRLVKLQRKQVTDRRWSWEVVVDGEVLQRPPPDVDNIRQDMDGFDGKLTGCSLTDNDSGARVWCYGEPDRRVLVVHFVGGGMDGDYTLARRDCPETEPVRIRAFEVDAVPAREVLSSAQALEIVLAFFARRPIPSSYHWERRDAARGNPWSPLTSAI